MENKIFNNELINFLVNVLQICDEIRALKKKKRISKIRIKAIGCDEEIVYKGEHGFAEELLNYVLFACQNSYNRILFSAIHNDTHGEDDITEVLLKNRFITLEFERDVSIPNFEKIEKAINQLFIEENLKNDLLEKLDTYKKLIEIYALEGQFINRDKIKEYLLKYIDILTFLLRNEEIIKNDGRTDILKPILNFCDVDKIKDDVPQKMSLYSPISLYLLLNIYYRIDEYIDLELEDDEGYFTKIYSEIFIKKVIHSYRWYLADGEKELFHVAISPYVDEDEKGYNLSTPVHRLQRYSSFEGVRELRLAEKIIYELEKNSNQTYYSIAILGDLQIKRICELCEYLSKIIKNKISVDINKDIQIHIDVYTKTQYEESETTHKVDCCSYNFLALDDILKRKNILDNVISNHSLLFLLDNLDLYNDVYVEEYYNPEFYKQNLKYYDYKKALEDISVQKDIAFDGIFKELHETLTAYLYSGKWGYLKKIANNTLLQYLESKVCKENEERVVYVYVSDLNAFQELYRNDKYFVRREQYAGKEIGIIRYASMPEEKTLKNSESSSYILVFNMWQFVKHIVIDEREFFLERLLKNVIDMDLKQIHIGVQYDRWREKVVLDYYLEDALEYSEGIVSEVENFISKVLVPIFNGELDYMYDDYVHKSISSFLYSDATCVEDMLFIHLFKNHREKMGKAELKEQHNPWIVKEHIRTELKYAYKRLYEMALESYDICSSEYIGQYKTIELLEKSIELKDALEKVAGEMNGKIDARRQLFSQIVKACEETDYMDSYIYIHSKSKLEMG